MRSPAFISWEKSILKSSNNKPEQRDENHKLPHHQKNEINVNYDKYMKLHCNLGDGCTMAEWLNARLRTKQINWTQYWGKKVLHSWIPCCKHSRMISFLWIRASVRIMYELTTLCKHLMPFVVFTALEATIEIKNWRYSNLMSYDSA